MTLSERLKAETRAAHDTIEAAFDLDRHLSTRESYRDLLLLLLGIHAEFEALAHPHLAGTGLEDHLCRADRIRRDLAVLGSDADDTSRPCRGRLGFIEDRPQAVGALYVVEGSTMGGVLIAQEVERRLGLGPESGAGFFSGHGRDSATAWRAFRGRLDQFGDPGSDDRVVAAALSMFTAMQERLSRAVLERAA